MILYYNSYCQSEFKAVCELLDWQEVPYKVIESLELLRYTKGVDKPVLLDKEGKVLGVGFFSIVRYVENFAKV